jgi:hypothetical protein
LQSNMFTINAAKEAQYSAVRYSMNINTQHRDVTPLQYRYQQ